MCVSVGEVKGRGGRDKKKRCIKEVWALVEKTGGERMALTYFAICIHHHSICVILVVFIVILDKLELFFLP